jgi:hypothetical protein
MFSGPSRSAHRDQRSVLVALEVMLLWPRGVGGPAVSAEEASLWPVFAVVVGDRPASSSATTLFDLLNRPRRDGELAVVSARYRWSVQDPRNALLRLAIRGDAPVRFATDIIFPARRIIGVLDVVARGATIAITTNRRAARLAGRGVDIRRALNELVLLSCPSSGELATLADTLVGLDPERLPMP